MSTQLQPMTNIQKIQLVEILIQGHVSELRNFYLILTKRCLLFVLWSFCVRFTIHSLNFEPFMLLICIVGLGILLHAFYKMDWRGYATNKVNLSELYKIRLKLLRTQTDNLVNALKL
jgi:hypothetical protein